MKTRLNILFAATVVASITVSAQETRTLQLPERLHARTSNTKSKATGRKTPPTPQDSFIVRDAASTATPGSDCIIPDVMDGDGVRTRIQFTNVDSSYSYLTLTFADPGGFGTLFDVAGLGVVNTIKVSLPPKASYEVVTSGAGDFMAGWAIFNTSGRVIAQTTYEMLDANGNWQASTTPAASAFNNRITLHFDHREGWNTQVILVNCNPYSAMLVTMTVRNTAGQIVQTEVYRMDSLNAGALNSLRDTIAPEWTSGTVEFSVATGASGGIAAVALRFNDSGAFEAVAPQTVSGWVNY
ncbi:MAG TPA: hypothetical protein VGL53_27735 [Bryobacteraceae bacterium]|jgi:hypothetical protein